MNKSIEILKKELEQLKNKEVNIYQLEEKIDINFNYIGSILPYIENFNKSNILAYEYDNYYNNTSITLIYEKIDNNIYTDKNIFNVNVILKDFFINVL